MFTKLLPNDPVTERKSGKKPGISVKITTLRTAQRPLPS